MQNVRARLVVATFSNAISLFLIMFPEASANTADPNDAVRTSDSELIRLLRDGEAQTVEELKHAMGVTATAVRQRIERLLEAGLIERRKEVAGRGRPVFRYALTVEGHRYAGADASEFAEAMWREIMSLRDSPIRRRLVTAIARRLGKIYAAKLSAVPVQDPAEPAVTRDEPAVLEQRMRKLSQVLLRNQISANVHVAGGQASRLPVLDIGACPYPTLRDNPNDRSLCKMEEEMLSEALGAPVHLTSCRLDGDHCCQFTPVQADSPGN